MTKVIPFLSKKTNSTVYTAPTSGMWPWHDTPQIIMKREAAHLWNLISGIGPLFEVHSRPKCQGPENRRRTMGELVGTFAWTEILKGQQG